MPWCQEQIIVCSILVIAMVAGLVYKNKWCDDE